MISQPAASQRAVLLYSDLPSVSDERQAKFCMRYAETHHLEIVALAGRSPAAALAAIRSGTAEVVLAALEEDSLAQLVADVEWLGGWVRFVRPRHVQAAVDGAAEAQATLIRAALKNSGGDVELVSRLLGVPLGAVCREAGELGNVVDRRPQRLRAVPDHRRRPA